MTYLSSSLTWTQVLAYRDKELNVGWWFRTTSYYSRRVSDSFLRSNSRSATQYIPCLLRNPKVHYRVYMSPLSPWLCVTHRKKLLFYVEELLTPTQPQRLSAVLGCLFNILAATFHIWRPSPPSATRGRAMPWWQENHLTWNVPPSFLLFCRLR
jgi:hypothetical protein